jgi:hypothetical protein
LDFELSSQNQFAISKDDFLLQVFFVFAIFVFRETRFFRNIGNFAKLRNSRNSSPIFAKHENRFVASFAKFSRNKILSKTLPVGEEIHLGRTENTFRLVYAQHCILHDGEELAQMLLRVAAGDEVVIHIEDHKQQVVERSVHEALGSLCSILQPE